MDREVKFRGFRDKTEEWVYGYLVIREEPYLHDIIDPIGNRSKMTYAIRRGSEGQFTGLHDKNGKEIFEGDIVRHEGKNYEITFTCGGFAADGFYDTGQDYPSEFFSEFAQTRSEVIGNIYENPELLEVDE